MTGLSWKPCLLNSRGPPRSKRTHIQKVRLPSLHGSLPGLEDGPPTVGQASCLPIFRPVLEALSSQLEWATAKQKIPHSKGTLAFAAWVIARLGGWTAYYGKPGPKVMRLGLEAFRRIKYGTTLRLQNV